MLDVFLLSGTLSGLIGNKNISSKSRVLYCKAGATNQMWNVLSCD